MKISVGMKCDRRIWIRVNNLKVCDLSLEIN